MTYPILAYTTSFTLELPKALLPWRSELLEAFSERMEKIGTVAVNTKRRNKLVYDFTLKESDSRRGKGPSIDYLVSCMALEIHNITYLGVSLHGNAKGK